MAISKKVQINASSVYYAVSSSKIAFRFSLLLYFNFGPWQYLGKIPSR